MPENFNLDGTSSNPPRPDEAERLKHEAVLIDGLMAYWRAQDEAEIREYTKVWMRELARGTDTPDEHLIERPEDGTQTRAPSLNTFYECWRTFARALFDSTVSALLSDPAIDIEAAMDSALHGVAGTIFGDGRVFDRLMHQTLHASFQAEAAFAQYNGYRLYRFDLANSIDQTIALERARWRARPAAPVTTSAKPSHPRYQVEPDPAAVERLRKATSIGVKTIAGATGKTVDAVRKKLRRAGLSGTGNGHSKHYPSKRVREIFDL